MLKCLSPLLIVLSLLSSSPALAQTSSVSTLETLVAKWVQLRKEISSEKRSWKKQEAHISEQTKFLEKEKTILNKSIQQASGSKSLAQEERLVLLKEKESAENLLQDLSRELDTAATDLRSWKKIVPASLLALLKHSFDKLENIDTLSVSEKLQLVIAIYTEIEKLQHRVHRTKELIAQSSGQQREMDVLYIGLSRGFALSRDKSFSALGIPSESGWKWVSRPDIRNDIEAALLVSDKKRNATLVQLLFALKDSYAN